MICRLFSRMVLVLVTGTMMASGARSGTYAWKISNLINPTNLATLRNDAVNPRVQKYVALLAEAKAHGEKPKSVAARAVELVGMEGKAAKLTAKAMAHNLQIAEGYGCLDKDGLARMRGGQPPVIRRGRYKGQKLSVDHVIPSSVVPELQNVIANLELLPLSANERKNAFVGKRQLELGRRLEKAGLLSRQGLSRLEQTAKPEVGGQ